MKSALCNMTDILEAVKELDPYKNEEYQEKDDITAGLIFADIFSNVVRFNQTTNTWFYFDGVIWKDDPRGVKVKELSQKLQRALQSYSATAEADKHFQGFVYGLSKQCNRDKMIKDATPYNYFSNEDLDAENDYINLKNCVLNLKTFEVMEHCPDMLFSKVANVNYNPDATSTDFEKFISEIMQGDTDKIRYLKKLLGYCLTAEANLEKFFIFYGATTRNGKSTLLETFSYLMGDYAVNADSDSFTSFNTDMRSAKTDIARLHGARFVHVSEAQKRMKLNGALIKGLTGQDTITARNLYEREFEFTPVLKLIFNTNFLPQISDLTLFSSGRVSVIPFDRHFEEHEQDKGLKERLKQPDNLSGVLNWCLDGLRLYREEGLEPPESIIKATEEYRADSDKIQQFIDDCLEKYPDDDPEYSHKNTKGKDAYKRYTAWCQTNGYGVEGKQNFYKELRTKGILRQGYVDGVSVRDAIIGYKLINY